MKNRDLGPDAAERRFEWSFNGDRIDFKPPEFLGNPVSDEGWRTSAFLHSFSLTWPSRFSFSSIIFLPYGS